ncbi:MULTISPECIES: DUF4089 domain-containing protein [Acidocella]|uniref:DUF4089 domain-containing protein n=1 Tax=Acidocella TaxID=50709 RepID=UPI00028DFA39|nr:MULTISPECIES: DUF4089 domain-containing protein [Acidocella]EKM99521.1 hypothetical protein MXAZACID_10023 [Acidocella sp. MX-AZ02]WBO58154.1 DUF4089 domain-containing protein [Acidocella sp. MX-AZ03]
MSAPDEAAYLAAASKLLGLPIRPEHQEAVQTAFAVLCAQAALIRDFPLPAQTEAAPRFTP